MNTPSPEKKTHKTRRRVNKPDPLKKTLTMLKSIGAIVAVPLALFALMSNIFSNPVTTLAVALVLAIAASIAAVRLWKANALTIIVAWLMLIVAALTVFTILPKTITVEGLILDSSKNPVRHEKVILLDVDGISRETETDDTGYYQFKKVPNDSYRVKVRDTEAGGNAGGLGRILVQVMSTNLILPIPTSTSSPTATSTNTPTAIFTPTPSLTPSPTLTPTPTPHIIAGADDLSSWRPTYCDEKCGGENGKSSIQIRLVPGRNNNVLEVSYDLKNTGYAIVTKNIDPKRLSGTDGIAFHYKGSGAANTLEFKLMLRYPGDTDDTAYGISWPNATNTDDTWTLKKVLYSDLTCWWPAKYCQLHGDRVNLNMVLRMDIAVSNKPGDSTGSGIIYFDDILGILQP